MENFIPYCGAPPVPGDLHWNLDPVLISLLIALAAAYFLAARSHSSPTQRGFFVIGLVIASLALISPLCNLSVALFSARVAQHMILTLIAAPLVVAGRPERAIKAVLFRRRSR